MDGLTRFSPPDYRQIGEAQSTNKTLAMPTLHGLAGSYMQCFPMALMLENPVRVSMKRKRGAPPPPIFFRFRVTLADAKPQAIIMCACKGVGEIGAS